MTIFFQPNFWRDQWSSFSYNYSADWICVILFYWWYYWTFVFMLQFGFTSSLGPIFSLLFKPFQNSSLTFKLFLWLGYRWAIFFLFIRKGLCCMFLLLHLLSLLFKYNMSKFFQFTFYSFSYLYLLFLLCREKHIVSEHLIVVWFEEYPQ